MLFLRLEECEVAGLSTLKASKAEEVLWSRKLVSFKILLGVLELWQKKAGEGVGEWREGVREGLLCPHT